MYKDIRKYLKLPDFISISGVLASLGSIYFSLNKSFFYAAVFIAIAAFFDNIDGRVARKMNREGRFGIELDSLADVITFLLAPAIFGYMAIANSAYALAIYALFVICGVLRLSRFNITGTTEGYYLGLAVGYNGFIFLIYFLMEIFRLDTVYLIWVYLISAMLMISGVKIKKF